MKVYDLPCGKEVATDVDAVIAQAYGLMYEEKRAYYASVK